MGDADAAILALILDILVVAAILHLFPVMDRSILNGTERRNHSLDGLRGIVASCVVASHSIMGWVFVRTGMTGAPTGNVANQLGSCAVAIFFMISAYLFCNKIMVDRGRLRLLPFLEGRVMRIVPLYAACVAALTLLAFADRNYRLDVPVTQLVRDVLRWFAFDFVTRHPINADPRTLGVLGQVWTLRYEWMLYAILPVLALAVRQAGGVWPIFVGLSLGAIFYPLFAFFVAGAACALLVRVNGPVARWVWQIAGFSGLIAVVVFQHDSQGWRQAVLLTPFLVAVLQGHRLYALLGARPLRFLGEISYGLYLVHGFAILGVLGAGDWSHDGSAARFAMFFANLTAATALATVTFLLIERPFMGRRPMARLISHLAALKASGLVKVTPASPASPPAT